MAENDDAAPKPKRRQPRKRRVEGAPPVEAGGEAAPAAAAEPVAPATAAGPETVAAGEPAPAPAEPAGASEPERLPEAHAGPMVVTIFGGSGFIGRRLVTQLLEAGARVKVASREGKAASAPAGGHGSLEMVKAGIGDEDAVRAAVAGTTAVINLVGILHEGGGQSFAGVHVDGASASRRGQGRRRAPAGAHVGAGRFGRIAVDLRPEQGRREAAVREVFPEASIVRPSIVFGPEDDFFNRFAAMAKISPALPLIGGGTTRFQPVYVGDVAAAIARYPRRRGHGRADLRVWRPRRLHLQGTDGDAAQGEEDQPRLVPVPFLLAEIQGAFCRCCRRRRSPATRSSCSRPTTCSAVRRRVSAALGITPTPLEAVLPTYL